MELTQEQIEAVDSIVREIKIKVLNTELTAKISERDTAINQIAKEKNIEIIQATENITGQYQLIIEDLRAQINAL